MAEKIVVIPSGKLDITGLKKIGKSLLLTLGAATIAWLGDIANIVDFGNFNSIILIALPFVVNTLKIWLSKYESKQ